MVDALIQVWLPRVARNNPRLVSLLLAALIGLECVRMALTLLSGNSSISLPPAATRRPAHTQRPSGIDAKQIVAAHLFGVAAEDSSQDPASPALSAENLVLVGTIATERPRHGIAIIAVDGPAKVYRVGDGIGGASLHSVYLDRVVLDRGGRLETLPLPRGKFLRGQGAAGPRLASADDAAPALTNPASSRTIAQVIQAQASVDGPSGMRGFRIHPSHNIRAFLQSGLRQNDVMTAINGTSLSGEDEEHAQEVLASLLEARQATVTVMRNGQPVDISIDLSQ